MRRSKAFFFGGLVLAAAHLMWQVRPVASQQGPSGTPAAQAVSQSGLLPIYGLDFNFDPAWVDGSAFPSSSPSFPNLGVNAVFQQGWEAVKPSGFGVIRFAVDVREGRQAASRVANLCQWAQANGARILPVLTGSDQGKFPDKGFAQSAGAFVTSLIGVLRHGEGQYLPLYGQIIAYQIEDQLNHVALHQPLFPQYVPPMVSQVATQIRRAEEAGFQGTQHQATPLLINFSFDFELILEQGIAGNPVSEDLLGRAYDSFKARYLTRLSSLRDIDVIDVQWLAGSLGGGGPELFSSLLRRLIADLPGKQLLFTTGCSTGFHSQDEQARFAGLSFANVAGFRATVGGDSPFLGLMLREAFSRASEGNQQPRDTSRWNWREKAIEVVETWSAKRPSEDAIWWLNRVESGLGLFTMRADSSGNAWLEPNSVQQGLNQIAVAVSESAASTQQATPSTQGSPPAPVDQAPAPPGGQYLPSAEANPAPQSPGQYNSPASAYPATPSSGRIVARALVEKGTQGMLMILDRVFERLGDKVSGRSSDAPSYASSDPGSAAGPPAAVLPGTPPATPMIAVSRADVVLSPAAPRVGEAARFSVTLHNPGTSNAQGLVLALVDDAATLLGEETQLTDIAIPGGGTRDFSLRWIPSEPGSQSANVWVLDSTLTQQLATLAFGPIVVANPPATESAARRAAASAFPRATNPAVLGSGDARLAVPLGLPHVRGLRVDPPMAGPTGAALGAVTTSMVNPYSRLISNVTATLVVDGRTIATRSLGTLLPRQERAVFFPSVAFTRTGSQEVKILVESRGVKRLIGSYSKLVELPLVASAPAVGPGVGVAAPPVAATVATPVRSMVPLPEPPAAVARPAQPRLKNSPALQAIPMTVPIRLPASKSTPLPVSPGGKTSVAPLLQMNPASVPENGKAPLVKPGPVQPAMQTRPLVPVEKSPKASPAKPAAQPKQQKEAEKEPSTKPPGQ